MIVDVVYPLTGDCVHVGYQYPLFAALCYAQSLKNRPEVMVGPIEGVMPMGHGLLRLLPDAHVRLRAPQEALDFVEAYAHRDIRIGGHIVQTGRPSVRMLRPGRLLHAEMVVFSCGKSGESRARFTVQRFREALFGHVALDSDQVVIGEPRSFRIRRYVNRGCPVELRGLTDEQSIALQSRGLGGRRHFGAGVLLPGPLPQGFRRATRRYVVRP